MRRLFFAVAACCQLSAAIAQTQRVEVLDFLPAPGQYVNALPAVAEGASQADANRACEEQLNGGGLVSLGAFGGYVVVRFDHPVENRPGSDILVLGNGYYASPGTLGGSIEPGIVCVGVGDDHRTAKWYELAGSEFHSSEVRDFEVTYFRPAAESGPHTLSYSSFDEYVRWECSWTDAGGARRDSSGFHPKNTFHTQAYWPLWAEGGTLTFRGGRLPNNAVEQSGNGTGWVQYRYAADAYGYADACAANDSLFSSFDIDWAVDDDGKLVTLERVDFIRVSTAIFQHCGWIGETSTEIRSIADLHLIEGYDANPFVIASRPKPDTGLRPVVAPRAEASGAFYALTGQRVARPVPGRLYVRGGKLVVCKNSLSSQHK